MCTRDKEFTIVGIGDCLARGYDRTGFFEVDTGEQRAWTVQLTESSEHPVQKPPTVSSAPPGASSPAATVGTSSSPVAPQIAPGAAPAIMPPGGNKTP